MASVKQKKMMEILDVSKNVVLPSNYICVNTVSKYKEFLDFISSSSILAVDTETTGLDVIRDDMVGFSVYAPSKGFYIPLLSKVQEYTEELEVPYDPSIDMLICDNWLDILGEEGFLTKTKQILSSKDKKLLFHNSKFDQHVLYNNLGIDVKVYFDTRIASFMLDETISHSLKDLGEKYLGIHSDKFAKLFSKVTFEKVPLILATKYAINDVELTYRLYEHFSNILDRPNMSKLKYLVEQVELPFSQIILESERRGIRFNKDIVDELEPVYTKELEELRVKISRYIGDININSPKQLSEALYIKLGVPNINNNSTDKHTLTRLMDKHEVIPLLIKYRKLSKMLTSFILTLPNYIVNNRIHVNFNTLGCVTGRMSCNNPNVQQMPKESRIRNGFEADEGRLLVSIDFSAQELRLMGHLSNDETLINAFLNNQDVHSLMATKIWNSKNPDCQLEYEEFEIIRTDTENTLSSKFEKLRSSAKAVNFGKFLLKKNPTLNGESFKMPTPC